MIERIFLNKNLTSAIKNVIPYYILKSKGLNFLPRIIYASRYFNAKYFQIIKWGFTSREDNNYTYDLTDRNISYLAWMISSITNSEYKTVLGYVNELRNDKKLKNYIIEKTKNSPYRIEADLRAEYGRRMGWYAFVRATKPKIVVETGVDKGIGAVVLCAGLLRNINEGSPGMYYGTDNNPIAGYLLDEEYASVGEIMYGDSIDSLKKFNKKIDLFINDSDHSAEYEAREYRTIEHKLSKKSIILGDNSHDTNKLDLFSQMSGRTFLFFKEEPKDHWYPGAGIGISY